MKEFEHFYSHIKDMEKTHNFIASKKANRYVGVENSNNKFNTQMSIDEAANKFDSYASELNSAGKGEFR